MSTPHIESGGAREVRRRRLAWLHSTGVGLGWRLVEYRDMECYRCPRCGALKFPENVYQHHQSHRRGQP